MDQPDDHALLLGYVDGRDQVAVSRDDRGVTNLMLTSQQCEIETKQQVNPLLLEDRLARLSLPRYARRPRRTS